MAWVTWRQQRATLIAVIAVLAAVGVFLVVFGLRARHDYAHLVNCPLDPGRQSSACAAAFKQFNSTDWTVANTCAILMQLAPVLIGAFAGAPLLARELENGTYRFAWTQGLGRERQAIAKLALLGVTIVVLVGAFGALFSWFFQPFLYPENMNGLTETVFDTSGIVFPAFALVSFAIGAFLGMLLRRVIPALAATLGVYLAVRLAAWGVRKYYPLAVVTGNSKIFSTFSTPGTPGYPWILSTWVTGPAGQPASAPAANRIINGPPLGAGGSVPAGYTEWTRWIPLSHYWPMQFIEAGWLLVLAIALFAATVSLVRRRAA
jgi:hypothetical protein